MLTGGWALGSYLTGKQVLRAQYKATTVGLIYYDNKNK